MEEDNINLTDEPSKSSPITLCNGNRLEPLPVQQQKTSSPLVLKSNLPTLSVEINFDVLNSGVAYLSGRYLIIVNPRNFSICSIAAESLTNAAHIGVPLQWYILHFSILMTNVHLFYILCEASCLRDITVSEPNVYLPQLFLF